MRAVTTRRFKTTKYPPPERPVGVGEGAAVARVAAVEGRGEAFHPDPEVPQEHVKRVAIHGSLETSALGEQRHRGKRREGGVRA